MGMLELWVILILCGISLQSEVLNAKNLACHSSDLKALEGFMKVLQSTIGWKWNKSSSFSSNCCNWVGITCISSFSLGLHDEFDSGRVVKLELGRKKLTGKLSESLGSLNQLKSLNLSHNSLKGSIPKSLLNLQKLEVLDLSNNGFSGVLPMAINLPSLRVFDISGNSFQGLIPSTICKNSPNVQAISFALNNFNGSIPLELGNCSSLEYLGLCSNHLSGTIPEDLFKLPNLATLILQDNRLSGQLSNNVGNLSNLVQLDISSNNFSGSIPNVFHRLHRLQRFSAHSNNFTGKLPHTLLNSNSIILLQVRNNSLEGRINVNCSSMTSLASLHLASNRFHGPIPDNLPYCPQLKTINFARNNLTGQIPESFNNFSSLSSLSFSRTSVYNIYAALEILHHCKKLRTLIITSSFHEEELPSIPSFQFTQLKILIIANCQLTGTIPKWLKGSPQLQLLDLSWNHLEGTIPSWFGSFNDLFYLDLSNNSLIGEIPRNLTCLQSLISRNICFEEPSLDFPFFMKSNLDSRGLQYNKLLSIPPMLDLSENVLSGSIWPEFGNLQNLHILNLRNNKLSGGIPASLSGMTNLETLDLSRNNLSGKIPVSLVRLSFLSLFSVAYNNISGAVPTGGQFTTFPNSSFEGNQGLYRENVSTACQITNGYLHEPVVKQKKNIGVIVAMAVGIGFGTALFLALILLIVLRKSTSRRVVDPENEADGNENEHSSRLVVLFENKEHNNELSLDDILKSTECFNEDNIIGCGGFGMVYKATLPDGTKVAIKRLSGDACQMDKEFHAEVETLSRARHPNLVQLLGYCEFKDDRLLIYPYMDNGSLDYWLHEKMDGHSSLDWDTRLHIAQGVARGLAYLHQSCEPHILHRDIKSSNILLDENFAAHLADFGLARLILPYNTHVTTDLVGTLGYIPPEYGQASVATYKGDVYSFGVVLLELLTGRRPMDMCESVASRNLISRVIEMKKEKREVEIFDPTVFCKEHAKEMLVVLEIACLCISECPKTRPSSQQLVSWLDNLGIDI